MYLGPLHFNIQSGEVIEGTHHVVYNINFARVYYSVILHGE